MKENYILSEKIRKIIEELEPQPAEISFAVINLKTVEPEISGYNMDSFIYPASVYKIFVGAEVFRKADAGLLYLSDIVEITLPNDVDKDIQLFPKNTRSDNRPLLMAGDKVTIEYLLNLIFSRSDNTAANTLMNIAKKEDMNENIIVPYGWQGSEVTQKLLDRLKVEKEYRVSKITVSCGRHLTELCWRIEMGTLVNEKVSAMLKNYMHTWNRGGREGLYIPEFVDYYRKGGWLEINGYKINIFSAIKNSIRSVCAVNKWCNDAGVVTPPDGLN